MYVSLRRYNFIAKVINNGRMEVKNSLVRKLRMSRVPGRRNQTKGGIISYLYWLE